MFRATGIALLAVVTIAYPTSAQHRGHHRTSKPNCSKGVPCGNTCIPAGRQCHVDEGSPSSDSQPEQNGQNDAYGPDQQRADSETMAAEQEARARGVVSRDAEGRIIRSEAAKRRFMMMSGYPNSRPGYVVDHVKPLACGGADDPNNMQWQTVEEAKAKDKVERQGCATHP
ncbi:MAG TPA: HNH endonuclease signature motif containing protein [Gemmatimonadales bacterium]|nr:HNH endonuclease signature motif containing protein [Gemmatimonadales bacterium]